MDTKEWRRSFWHGAAVADRSVSVWTKCESGLERFHPELLSSTWAAGPGFRLPRFWSVKALAPLALMQHHPSFKLSSVISRTHPSFARRCRIRDSSIALSMVSWHGDSCSCFPPKTSAALSKRSPGYWCPGPVAVYVSPGTDRLERCDDRIGIALPRSRRVPSAHVSSWSLCSQ